MRALILRRVSLIQGGVGGPVLIGPSNSSSVAGLQNFLTRNSFPHHLLDPERDHDAAEIIARYSPSPSDWPLVVAIDGTVLRNPSENELARAVGMIVGPRGDKVYDAAIVGCGPAGLATAVYAASEGLSVVVLDARAYGGQAGASARIENYLGFPTGISGHALAARAYNQAQKFGAEVAIPVTVETLDCGGSERKPGEPLILTVSGGQQLRARTVVIASGARYRRLPVENMEEFEGAGISYWASPVEAKLCAGSEVALVGAGNSAGQAVVFLAPKVQHLHLIVRGPSLDASMSRYLIDRIAALPNVTVHFHAEVTSLAGDPATGLEGLEIRCKQTGKMVAKPIRHLFLFIGADPNASWLADCPVALDKHGFILTGDEAAGEPWPAFGRRALPLETSVPGVFAIGDVRSGSIKRVAAAVGEGAQVVAALHSVLAAH